MKVRLLLAIAVTAIAALGTACGSSGTTDNADKRGQAADEMCTHILDDEKFAGQGRLFASSMGNGSAFRFDCSIAFTVGDTALKSLGIAVDQCDEGGLLIVAVNVDDIGWTVDRDETKSLDDENHCGVRFTTDDPVGTTLE